jgi:hypothetical protein
MNHIGFIKDTEHGKLYKCHYTGHIALEQEMVFEPSPMPQCPATLARYDSEESRLKRKESFSAFNEMDANCNTCKHFNRQHADNAKGSHPASNFVYGSCRNEQGKPELSPYKSEFQIMLHVADYMGMQCWEARK